MSISIAGSPWYTPYAPNGLQLMSITSSTFNVAPGITPNSDYQNLITLPNLTSVNMATNGLNGLDTGTLTASTKYYVFAVGSSNNPLDDNGGYSVASSKYPAGAIISTSAIPSLPFNYDMYRRIGFVYTDVSNNLVTFFQNGTGADRTMQYVNEMFEVSGGTSATYTAVDVSSSVPLPGLTALLRLTVAPTAPGNSVNVATYGSTPSVGQAMLAGEVASVSTAAGPFQIVTGNNAGAASINYKVAGSCFISVIGYIDTL